MLLSSPLLPTPVCTTAGYLAEIGRSPPLARCLSELARGSLVPPKVPDRSSGKRSAPGLVTAPPVVISALADASVVERSRKRTREDQRGV